MSIKSFFLTTCCMLVGLQSMFADPAVTSVAPSSGILAGGNHVTITGSGFSGASNVDFGFRPAVSYTVMNDQTIDAVVPVGTPGTFDVTVTAALITSPTSADAFYTYTTTGWNGIVSADLPDAVALFNTATDTFTSTISTSTDSLTSVINPAGTFIYTANDSTPGVSVYDAATNLLVTTIPTSVGPGAFDMIVNPAGTRLYLSNLNSGYVTVIDTTTNTVVTDIYAYPNLGPLTITPDGSTVFASNFYGGIFPIDTATNTVQPLILTPVYPGRVAITPDGAKAFVPIFSTDEVFVWDLPSLTQTNTISLPSLSGPYGTSILPNGQKLYVANYINNTVSVIDLSSETLTTTIPLEPPVAPGAGVFWLASTPDSQKVYVISQFDSVVVPIDATTDTIGAPFATVNGLFYDMVISPDPAPVASFMATPQVIGTPTVFDASAALSPIGTIVSYAWDFGDGNTAMTASPTINHTYTIPGNYTVTLTVTNSAGTSTTQVFSSGYMSNNGGPAAQRTRIVAALPVPQPISLTGYQVKCCYLSKTRRTNVLKWSAPVGYTPAAYFIFKDAALTKFVAAVPADQPLVFKDPKGKNRMFTYYIVSVNAEGDFSAPVSVIINPASCP